MKSVALLYTTADYTAFQATAARKALAGYQAGLVIEQALAAADSLDQLELRKAVFSLSGKIETLDGPFALAPDGSQTGEILPLGQIIETSGQQGPGIHIVWPPDLANAKPIYPAP